VTEGGRNSPHLKILAQFVAGEREKGSGRAGEGKRKEGFEEECLFKDQSRNRRMMRRLDIGLFKANAVNKVDAGSRRRRRRTLCSA
jgi:hypothetical protein